MSFEVPPRISGAAPDPERLAEVRKRFAQPTVPVRPLPSNGTMMALCLAVFIVLAVILAGAVGFSGFRQNEHSRALDGLFSAAASGDGAVRRRCGADDSRVPVDHASCAEHIFGYRAAEPATALLLFPDFDTTGFVSRGISCVFAMAC